jgi:precorrin-2 dehydrogenase/sirohydrochlorin ferrochelatase
MAGLPVTLNVHGMRCLVVGAGTVGARKAATLAEAGAAVTVLAPERNRVFQPGDCAGHRLVVAATNDTQINDAVEADAHAHGAWCNRTDRPDGGDLAFAAVHRTGDVTIGVSTGGADPRRAAAVRDHIAALLGDRT